jgi:hypothetical protein
MAAANAKLFAFLQAAPATACRVLSRHTHSLQARASRIRSWQIISQGFEKLLPTSTYPTKSLKSALDPVHHSQSRFLLGLEATKVTALPRTSCATADQSASFVPNAFQSASSSTSFSRLILQSPPIKTKSLHSFPLTLRNLSSQPIMAQASSVEKAEQAKPAGRYAILVTGMFLGSGLQSFWIYEIQRNLQRAEDTHHWIIRLELFRNARRRV